MSDSSKKAKKIRNKQEGPRFKPSTTSTKKTFQKKNSQNSSAETTVGNRKRKATTPQPPPGKAQPTKKAKKSSSQPPSQVSSKSRTSSAKTTNTPKQKTTSTPSPPPARKVQQQQQQHQQPAKKVKKKPTPSPALLNSNWTKLAKEIGVNPVRAPTPSPSDGDQEKGEMKGNREKEMEALKERAKVWLSDPAPLPDSHTNLTKRLAVDCEMVGVGPDGMESILAEIAIVNETGACVYHSYAKPTEFVTNWRTKVSGIRPEHMLKEGKEFAQVQSEVAEILKGRIVLGHHLQHDFRALKLSHPFKETRDTAKFRPLTRQKAKPRALKWLVRHILDFKIQQGAHSPIIDARASMLLFFALKRDWEEQIEEKNRRQKKKKKKHQDKVTIQNEDESSSESSTPTTQNSP